MIGGRGRHAWGRLAGAVLLVTTGCAGFGDWSIGRPARRFDDRAAAPASPATAPAGGGSARSATVEVWDNQETYAARFDRLAKANEEAKRRQAGEPGTARNVDPASLAAKLDQNRFRLSESPGPQPAAETREPAGGVAPPGAKPEPATVAPQPAGTTAEPAEPAGNQGPPTAATVGPPIVRITAIKPKPKGTLALVDLDQLKGFARPSVSELTSPRPAAPTTRADDEPNQRFQNANQGLSIPGPAEGGTAMDKLATLKRQLEKKVKDRPEDVGTTLRLQLLYAVLGEWEQAMQSGAAGGAGDAGTSAKLSEKLVRLIKIFDDNTASTANQANQALALIEELQNLLREQADLQISALQLCQEVVSFGNYRPMPESYFRSGKERQVIVYLELEYFRSSWLEDKKEYETLISLTVELLDNQGRLCGRQYRVDRIRDLSPRRRRDFFIAPIVTLPSVAPGEYVLKVTASDLIANKTTQRTLSVTYQP